MTGAPMIHSNSSQRRQRYLTGEYLHHHYDNVMIILSNIHNYMKTHLIKERQVQHLIDYDLNNLLFFIGSLRTWSEDVIVIVIFTRGGYILSFCFNSIFLSSKFQKSISDALICYNNNYSHEIIMHLEIYEDTII